VDDTAPPGETAEEREAREQNNVEVRQRWSEWFDHLEAGQLFAQEKLEQWRAEERQLLRRPRKAQRLQEKAAWDASKEQRLAELAQVGS
jgi:hypothetical protein